MPPYVGLNGKQDGGYIQCISVQTLILPPGGEFYTSKDTLICYLALPHLTVARRLLEIVAKVTNLETVKIEFCHLFFFFFLLPLA